MFIIANLLVATARVLDIILSAYLLILIARIVVSWINVDPYHPVVRFLYNVTEPILEKVRQTLPVVVGGFDISPIILWIGIVFAKSFLIQSLYDMARALQ
jgi:YggT family protein